MKRLACILTICISVFYLSSCQININIPEIPFFTVEEDAKRQILCQDLYFVTETGEKVEDGEMIEYKLTDSNISYQLYWVMETGETSNKEVEFESSDPMVKVNSLGLVIFLEETDVIITIRAIDGSGKTDNITLVPKRMGDKVDL